ncbi:MAG: hypothetical protein IKQ04_05195 [Oscillospiraceae bacterium]|nr:hypothetical protein [Oscillospiraceae bacterium]
MTIRKLLETWNTLVMSLMLLLLTAHILLILSSHRYRRGKTRIILYWLHGLFSFLGAYFPLMNLLWTIDYNVERTGPAALVEAFGALPGAWVLFYEAATLLILALCFRELWRYGRTRPSLDSVKQAMDLLPIGLAIGRADGTVAQCNRTMDDLVRQLSGRGLHDLTLLEGLCGPTGEARLTLSDGQIWQLTRRPLTLEGEDYLQFAVEEITEQARILQDLERKHERLLGLRLRLERYNRQADRLIIAQELLSARMAVHSAVGGVLLEAQRYLRDPASYDEARLLQSLQYTNTVLLREYEQDDSDRNPLAEALEAAEILGVDVSVTGRFPEGEPFRGILAAAIRECAANTVKHADGDRLTVELLEQGPGGRDRTFLLCSNGTPPEAPIRESGGLLSLRSLVERKGGTMKARGGRDAEAAFRLEITIPGDCAKDGPNGP